MNRILIVLIGLGLLLAQTPLLAQGWIKTYYDYNSNWLNGFGEKTVDNGYVTVGYIGISSSNLHVKKTDAFGNIQWTYTMTKVGSQRPVGIKQIPSTGAYVILYNDSQNQASPHLLSLNSLGQELYDRTISIGMDVYTGSSNSDLLITTEEDLLIKSGGLDSLNFYTVGLAKLDLQGNTMWSKLLYHAPNYQVRPMDVMETTDGNYLLSCYIDTSTSTGGGNGWEIHLIKTDTAGNDLWQKTLTSLGGIHRPFRAINSSDGGYLITGDYNIGSNTQALTVKVDSAGVPEWNWKSASSATSNKCRGAVENADGSYTITGYIVPTAPPYNTIGFIKLSSTGALLLDNGSSTGTNVPNGKKIYTNADGGYSIFGVDAKGHFIITSDSLGVVYSNQVVGKYFHDVNANCIYDSGEPIIYNRAVYATKGTENRYTNIHSNGSYLLEVDTGTYTISTRTLSPYWQFCQNPQTVTFTNFYSRDTVDFALQILDTCTYMEVDLSTPILRRCFPSTYYVRYDNWGTADAQNAYVELTLDPYMTFDSSSIPMTQQTGNVYRFDIGTVPMTTNGAFAVHVTVDCDSTTALGQVHCVEAHIYPDTICIPNYWTGPVIRTSSTCLNDSVIFLLENIGTNMSAPQDYSIIEEHVMIQVTPFQLGAGANQSVTIPAAPGATYRMEAAQAAGFPPLLGSAISSSNYVGCNAPPVINFPSVLRQFNNGNTNPSVAVDCRANVGSYDPNDKQAQPFGYGVQHYIDENIPLNYHIRFQNTGTDTAFTVVVVDTIDAHLDPASIRMGASSHSYTWELRENGILVVTFDNIMLPDSNVNERASNGFFKFEIQQQANNPIGTVITNSAGIYFDFNAPIITNETFHTIGDDFIAVLLTGTENVLDAAIDIQVFPNPFKDFTTIQVNGKDYESLELEVLNVTGQLVETIQVQNSNQIILNRKQLVQGAYFYRLKGNDELLNTGKLIIR